MLKRTTPVLVLLAVAALALTACGSSGGTSTTSSNAQSGSTGSGSSETVDVSADPSNLAYQQKSLTAKAGNVDLHFDNPSTTTHDVCVRTSSGDELGCSDQVSSGTADLTVDLKPGTYTFYCSVDSHEQAGMEGKLTVK